MSIAEADIKKAVAHLRKADPVMKRLIAVVGPFTLKRDRDRFRILVRSIVSQQLSSKAARTISQRLEQLAAPGRLTAERLARLSPQQLRSVGLSSQKTEYVSHLAQLVSTGELPLGRIGRLSDEAVIEELTRVRGIGRWTAQMFLIFSLGRLDVFPFDDLGLRTAMERLYELKRAPDRQTGEEIASLWRPYCSVATWYCWRSLEQPPG